MKLSEYTQYIVTETNKTVKKIQLLFKHKQINPKNKSKFKLLLSKAYLNPETATYAQLYMQQKVVNTLFNECLSQPVTDENEKQPTKMSELFKQIFVENNKMAKSINLLFKTNKFCRKDTQYFDSLLSKAVLNPETTSYKQICLQQKLINLLLNEYAKETSSNITLQNQIYSLDGSLFETKLQNK